MKGLGDVSIRKIGKIDRKSGKLIPTAVGAKLAGQTGDHLNHVAGKISQFIDHPRQKYQER